MGAEFTGEEMKILETWVREQHGASTILKLFCGPSRALLWLCRDENVSGTSGESGCWGQGELMYMRASSSGSLTGHSKGVIGESGNGTDPTPSPEGWDAGCPTSSHPLRPGARAKYVVGEAISSQFLHGQW